MKNGQKLYEFKLCYSLVEWYSLGICHFLDVADPESLVFSWELKLTAANKIGLLKEVQRY